MSQHKVGNLRIFFHGTLAQCMDIRQHAGIAVLFMEKAILRLALYGFSMPQMVIPHNIKSLSA